MALGKGCLIAPINTCHSCGSVEFEVWLSSSAGVQTPWTCAAPWVPRVPPGHRLGTAGACSPGIVIFGRGVPHQTSARRDCLLPGGWGRLGDVTSIRQSLFCLGRALRSLASHTSSLSPGFLMQKTGCMPILALP